MKNQKLLFDFPAFSLKERFSICKGPEGAPPAPEAGKPNDAIESQKIANDFRLFLLSNKRFIADTFEENENRNGYQFNAQGYQFTISDTVMPKIGGLTESFSISIENSKHQVFEITFTHRGNCSVSLNETLLDESKYPKDFRAIILKFQKIIAEAINKAIEKTRSTPESRLALQAGDKLFNFLNGESKKIEEFKNYLLEEGINVQFKNGTISITIKKEDEADEDEIKLFLSKGSYHKGRSSRMFQPAYPNARTEEINPNYISVTGDSYEGNQELFKSQLEDILKLLKAALKRAAAKGREFKEGIREF